MGAGEYPDAKMREMIIGRLINQTIKTINQKRERLGRINAGTYQTSADDNGNYAIYYSIHNKHYMVQMNMYC